jgi:hypothetical protein
MRRRSSPGPWPMVTGLAPVPQSDSFPVTATRRVEPVSIDGVLSEAVWSATVPATGFVQGHPREEADPTERTEVRVLHDDGALYIGARPTTARRTRCRRSSPGGTVRRVRTSSPSTSTSVVTGAPDSSSASTPRERIRLWPTLDTPLLSALKFSRHLRGAYDGVRGKLSASPLLTGFNSAIKSSLRSSQVTYQFVFRSNSLAGHRTCSMSARLHGSVWRGVPRWPHTLRAARSRRPQLDSRNLGCCISCPPRPPQLN